MRIDGKPVFHLVAKITHPAVSLCDYEGGTWLWDKLRSTVEDALASTFMPDHLHVLAALVDPSGVCQRINRLLGHLARQHGLRFIGGAAAPKLIPDRHKLLTDCRYLALNPARARLSTDPLRWWFSTHRDVMGAVVEPWITADRLASALGRPRSGFAAWYHRYVSSDPTVAVAGTPLPLMARPKLAASVPLAEIARAVAAAFRTRPSAILQRGAVRDQFVALALEQGWTDLERLAEVCRCRRKSMNAIVRRITDLDLDPARTCLGDDRLRAGVPSWAPCLTAARVR